MSDHPHIDPDTSSDLSPEDLIDKRGHIGRDRRCIASGETFDVSELIRFVRDPEGVVTPDINQKLPGRGVWVTADIHSLHKAIKTKAFARGFKNKVSVPENLEEFVGVLLKRKVLGLISMAMKAGHLTVGYDQVRSAAQTVPLAYRIEASDGSEDGRGKIRVLAKAMGHEIERPMAPVIGCYSSAELGGAIGRDYLVHAAFKAGGFAKTIRPEVTRLAGFVPLIPEAWPDKAHEYSSK